ncbi:MAG: hypothetical protein HYS05_08425 [Acidobacteria bacterium]|nr:hypothetical protein [Acidobacteriota bacterium]
MSDNASLQGPIAPLGQGATALQPEDELPPTPEAKVPSPEETPISKGEPKARPQEETSAAAGRHDADIGTSATLDTIAGRRRPARYGLLVQFESRPDDAELGRLVDNVVWINEAHPAFTRAAASRSLGYHTALAVALALAPLAVEPRDEHVFITQFLAHWGGAQSVTRRARSRQRKTK